MNRDKALARWVSAGIVTQEQASAIEAYEREHASFSWVLFGLTGLGSVVMLLGVVSIIAANWADISDGIKLTLYFLLLAGLGFATAKQITVPGVVREALLSSFALFILAGIGLIAQVYHVKSDGYSGLFMWLALALPVTLTVHSRLLCNIWFVIGITAVCLWNGATLSESSPFRNVFVTIALPYISVGIGYLLATRAEFFAAAARIWGYAVILLPFCITGSMAWAHGVGMWTKEDVVLWPLLPLSAAACAYGAACIQAPRKGGAMTWAIAVLILISLVLVLPPVVFGIPQAHPILGCALFIAAWSAAAVIAAVMGRRRLFDVAALVIGIRFIIVYFEVFGSLAATGVGLILSGGVILSISYAWFKYRRVIAKALQEAA